MAGVKSYQVVDCLVRKTILDADGKVFAQRGFRLEMILHDVPLIGFDPPVREQGSVVRRYNADLLQCVPQDSVMWLGANVVQAMNEKGIYIFKDPRDVGSPNVELLGLPSGMNIYPDVYTMDMSKILQDLDLHADVLADRIATGHEFILYRESRQWREVRCHSTDPDFSLDYVHVVS